MLHSTLFSTEEYYRIDNFDPLATEGPLVTQFCGDDPATVLAAARLTPRFHEEVERIRSRLESAHGSDRHRPQTAVASILASSS